MSKENNYTYLLEYSNGMLYHGVRSCNCNIADDKYYGSSKHTPADEIPKKTILTEHSTREDAVSEEVRYHKEFNVKCNDLYYNQANQTTTGFDTTGYIHTEENKRKMSETRKDRKHSAKSIQKMSKPKSEEWKIKNRKPKSNTTNYYGNTNAKGNLGKQKTESHKMNISKSKIGVKRGAFSDEWKQAMKEAKAREPIRKCPHCELEGKGANMTRYHFDNCKEIKYGT